MPESALCSGVRRRAQAEPSAQGMNRVDRGANREVQGSCGGVDGCTTVLGDGGGSMVSWTVVERVKKIGSRCPVEAAATAVGVRGTSNGGQEDQRVHGSTENQQRLGSGWALGG
uniref:Uncharacterized protein n=1 Tax=Opuntia streptacantha TaxID=393608 RepID=A0A7C8ZS13_OPUST